MTQSLVKHTVRNYVPLSLKLGFGDGDLKTDTSLCQPLIGSQVSKEVKDGDGERSKGRAWKRN